MNEAEVIINNKIEFLKFLKLKFTLIHNSNLFFRDVHYGVMEYLAKLRKKVSYTDAETITSEVLQSLEKENILKRVDSQSWILYYPEFALPKVDKKEPAAA